MDIRNSNFKNVGSDVAAIFIDGESHLTVDDCSFDGNFSSKNVGEAGIVRAVNGSSVDVRNSYFQDVSSDVSTIDIDGASHLFVDGCSFGGKFFFANKNAGIVRATNSSSVDVRNTNFQDVSSNGAAIDVQGVSHLTVDGCFFRGDPASLENGKKTGTVQTENASPVNKRNAKNPTTKYAYEAGIVRATNTSVVVRNTKFRDVSSHVAAIHVVGKRHLDISVVTFARITGYQGSAIYATDGSSVRIANSSFSGCDSSMTGTVTIESNALTP